jgi:hypothetical protein
MTFFSGHAGADDLLFGDQLPHQFHIGAVADHRIDTAENVMGALRQMG